MRSKSNPSRVGSQMNLFGWVEEPSCPLPTKAPRGHMSTVDAVHNQDEQHIRHRSYREWRRDVAEHMWKKWYVRIDEAINETRAVDERRLLEAHEEGIDPKVYVNDLAAHCDWIDFGPWG